MRKHLSALFSILFLFLLSGFSFCGAEILYETGFGRGEWEEEDWIFVKSPRWDYRGSWIQMDDHIKNLTPEGHDPDRVIGRPHGYMSMVLEEAFSTRETLLISCLMEFNHDQGPQIVLAWDIGENEEGYPEYRDHFEIVLWSQGINVWHHICMDGKPSWLRTSYARFPLERRVPHEIEVRIEKPYKNPGHPEVKGRKIAVSVNGDNLFSYLEPGLPEEIHVGITGYASINRFYNFSVAKR